MPPDVEPGSKRQFSVIGLVSAGCAIAATSSLLSLGASQWWLLELFSHFRVQYFVFLALASPVFAWVGARRSAAVYGEIALLNLILIITAQSGGAKTTPSRQPVLRLAVLNVNTANQEFERVREFLRETSADLVVLIEVDDRWMQEMKPLQAAYPYSMAEPSDDNFGIALFSKVSLEHAEFIELGNSIVPAVSATFQIGTNRVTLLGVHFLPPANSEDAATRNAQFAALAQLARSNAPPIIVVGDFNSTPWSPWFSRFTRDSGLRHSLLGFGFRGTWPTAIPILSIPLDHVFVSESVTVVNHRLGPDIGSDHAPVVAEVEF